MAIHARPRANLSTEVLCKALSNNLYVLIMAMVERDIKPDWIPAVEQLGLLV